MSEDQRESLLVRTLRMEKARFVDEAEEFSAECRSLEAQIDALEERHTAELEKLKKEHKAAFDGEVEITEGLREINASLESDLEDAWLSRGLVEPILEALEPNAHPKEFSIAIENARLSLGRGYA